VERMEPEDDISKHGTKEPTAQRQVPLSLTRWHCSASIMLRIDFYNIKEKEKEMTHLEKEHSGIIANLLFRYTILWEP
jgi:hypothetical protein